MSNLQVYLMVIFHHEIQFSFRLDAIMFQLLCILPRHQNVQNQQKMELNGIQIVCTEWNLDCFKKIFSQALTFLYVTYLFLKLNKYLIFYKIQVAIQSSFLFFFFSASEKFLKTSCIFLKFFLIPFIMSFCFLFIISCIFSYLIIAFFIIFSSSRFYCFIVIHYYILRMFFFFFFLIIQQVQQH